NVSIKGKGENKAILNANGEKNVLYLRNVQHAKIDGITITNGSADNGGGFYCFISSPSLSNVTITENSANDDGGGIYCFGSSPSLSNVTVTRNSAKNNGGGFFCLGSSPSLSNVTITENSANDDGGGIYCDESSPSLSNVTITGNSANDDGGGIYCDESSPSLSNVTITRNSAKNYGGGIYCDASNIFLVNSILWHNSPQAIYLSIAWRTTTTIINYSNIENGFDGIVNTDSNNTILWQDGNISTPPLFINPDDNFQLQTNSPCINSGHRAYPTVGGSKSYPNTSS
ncbi:hypothetical protein MHK_006647, partial [Candidatus Magnetomorum sp. HK-1]